MMHIILHGLKYAFEAATIIVVSFGILSFIFASAGDNSDNQAMARSVGDLFGIGFFLLAFALFIAWWALVHFAHLPWWK